MVCLSETITSMFVQGDDTLSTVVRIFRLLRLGRTRTDNCKIYEAWRYIDWLLVGVSGLFRSQIIIFLILKDCCVFSSDY